MFLRCCDESGAPLFYATAKECSGSAVRLRHCPATVMRAPWQLKQGEDGLESPTDAAGIGKVLSEEPGPALKSCQSGDRFRCQTSHASDGEAEEFMMLSSFEPQSGHVMHAGTSRRFAFILLSTFLLAAGAHAVVVRGSVTDALGAPVAGERCATGGAWQGDCHCLC